MRGSGKRGLKKKDGGKMRKMRDTVDRFIRSQAEGEGEDMDMDHGLRFVKRKSRKELRKEKRKLKKAKMKCHYEGKKEVDVTPGGGGGGEGGGGGTGDASEVKKKKKKKGVKEEEKKEDSETSKSKARAPVKASQAKAPQGAGRATGDPVERSASQEGGKSGRLQESRKKALLEANEAEEREIRMLERCLGYNKRRNKKNLPQSFVDDGLDYVLGILDSGTAAAMYDSDQDVEAAKEKFAELDRSDSEMSAEEEEARGGGGGESEDEGGEEEDLMDEENELDGEEDDDDEMVEAEDTEEEEEGGEDDDDNDNDNDEEEAAEREASSSSRTEPAPAVRYVPPHLRDAGDDRRKAELQKLRRTVKGLMNRLSEANMASISNQLEELYMASSRKDMNEALTEELLSACVSPSLMPERLLMEHVLLVSVLHHTVGLEVGAHFLETVVRQLDEHLRCPGDGKESDNLVSLVSHLYHFQVVHARLVLDVLRLLVDGFSQRDLELLLLLLRSVGFSLRRDDALALKELISDAQRKASDAGATFGDDTRVRFMLETMLALKNNDVRKIPGYDPEPVERLKKLQRTLIQRTRGSSDVKLRVSLKNILEAEQVGRWWIVGSAWSGAPMIQDQEAPRAKEGPTGGQFSSRVLDLARKQRMNTEVRRNIFCVLMTSEDYLDAFQKLLRMGLKDQQEREIVHVLMDCCLQEKTFNPFYAVLGQKFCCHDRRFQMTFQFSLWDKFRELSNIPRMPFGNLVQLVAFFLHKKALSLSILKVIEFGELDKPKVRFLRQVLTKLLKEAEPEELVAIFGRISGIPKLGMLREGLKLFISHFLLKSAEGSAGGAELTQSARLASGAMDANDAKLKL